MYEVVWMSWICEWVIIGYMIIRRGQRRTWSRVRKPCWWDMPQVRRKTWLLSVHSLDRWWQSTRTHQMWRQGIAQGRVYPLSCQRLRQSSHQLPWEAGIQGFGKCCNSARRGQQSHLLREGSHETASPLSSQLQIYSLNKMNEVLVCLLATYATPIDRPSVKLWRKSPIRVITA